MARPWRALALALALSVPLAAASGPAFAAKAKPAKWAKSVCSSVGAWRDTIDAASEQATSAAPTKPKAAKKALLKVLDRTLKATKKLLKGLKKAGTPSVPGGKQMSSILSDGYEQAQSTLKAARKQLKRAGTSDPAAFVAEARAAEDGLEAGLEHVQQALRVATLIDEPALVEAFGAESGCADVMS